MRKLIESTLVSLDGVTEAPERWADFDAEDTARSLDELGKYDAFVMGRATYENFHANWSHVTSSPYMDLINAMPKYVASRTLTETKWNATLLGPDPSSAIAKLKSQPGKDLIKTAPVTSMTRSCETTSSTSSASGSGPSQPARDDGCSRVWTAQRSTSGSPTKAGWRTGR